MGNRLSKIYTRTGDDGRRTLPSQLRASCADCSTPGEKRGFRQARAGAMRPRTGFHARVVPTELRYG